MPINIPANQANGALLDKDSLASYIQQLGATAITIDPTSSVGQLDSTSTKALITTQAGVAVSGTSYNGSSQLTGFTKNGIAYTVAYPDSTHITVTGNGRTTTITLDGSGRVVSKVTA